ncbi:unnamed protein product [Menidia menidia]|uniref:(Atlantic silverside) hypothetical protein n=1 Tax=Menidia menidia TaxID=238744 RepID=A0A8S4BCM3_9TELE|nr:unnamed protein product [Menidia menidia]
MRLHPCFVRKRVRFDRAAEFLAACASGDTEEAGVMLEEAEDASRGGGDPGPDIACIDGSMEIVTFLLDHGADVNQVDSEGWTPLHVASSCGYPDIAKFLLQQGASLSAVNCDGDVPLDIAPDESTESVLQDYTLKQGVDLEAAKRREEEQIMTDARTWLTDGLPADVRHPKTGASPLHGEACRILAEQLCNMEARSNGGQTPFDVADESVEELLEELLRAGHVGALWVEKRRSRFSGQLAARALRVAVSPAD